MSRFVGQRSSSASSGGWRDASARRWRRRLCKMFRYCRDVLMLTKDEMVRNGMFPNMKKARAAERAVEGKFGGELGADPAAAANKIEENGKKHCVNAVQKPAASTAATATARGVRRGGVHKSARQLRQQRHLAKALRKEVEAAAAKKEADVPRNAAVADALAAALAGL